VRLRRVATRAGILSHGLCSSGDAATYPSRCAPWVRGRATGKRLKPVQSARKCGIGVIDDALSSVNALMPGLSRPVGSSRTIWQRFRRLRRLNYQTRQLLGDFGGMSGRNGMR
jgi:hypothetical protein